MTQDLFPFGNKTFTTYTERAAAPDTPSTDQNRIYFKSTGLYYVDDAGTEHWISGPTLDLLVYKGVIDCALSPNYPAADAGHVYVVSVAGKIGGGAGPVVEAGDLLLCKVDGTAAGDHVTVGASWDVVQHNIDLGNITITGGTINGTTVGGTTPAAGAFTTVNDLTLTSLATGFSAAGGTSSRTLTVDETKALSDKATLDTDVSFTSVDLGGAIETTALEYVIAEAKDASDNVVAKIAIEFDNLGAGTQNGVMRFYVQRAGTLTNILELDGGV